MLNTFRGLRTESSGPVQAGTGLARATPMEDVQMLNVNRAARIDDNAAFQRMFKPRLLTLGLFFPIEAFARDEPAMRDQERLARRAEELGFAALWFRDVPLRAIRTSAMWARFLTPSFIWAGSPRRHA